MERLKKFVLLLIFLPLSSQILANKPEIPGRVPDEFESDGGHMLGFALGGSSAVSGLSSVKSNPAMLPFEQQYQVTAGYHWPSYGREFFQAGVVDSKTSSFAAGFTYTAFREKFKKPDEIPEKQGKLQSYYDSPVKNRFSMALAQPFSNFSAGINFQYINNALEEAEKKRGVTFGIGLAGLITPSIRFGLSAENIANKDIKEYAPLIYRAGLAYTMVDGNVTAHLDYRHRQRVDQEYINKEGVFQNEVDRTFEKMMIFSCSARIQNLLRVLGGYGVEIGGSRSVLSGGVAVVNQSFSLSYLVSKPYLSNEFFHQAVNLSLQLAF